MTENINLNLQNIIRQDIIDSPAYQVHSSIGMIKLDAMENPFILPENLQKGLAQHLSVVHLNRYPSPEDYQTSVDIIRNYADIHSDLDILLGNGSDEIISMLANLIPDNSYILALSPSFVMYKASADIARLNFISIDLKSDDFNLDLEGMKNAIQKYNPRLIYLAYPNNPTGACFSKNDIDEIIKFAPNSLIIIDEAYQAFTNNKTYMSSLPDIIKQYPNILVMRTLSKIGLAGLRLGYIAGHKQIIQQLNKVRPPYNINVLTQASIEFLLSIQENIDTLNMQAQIICQQRIIMAEKLDEFGKVFNSDANFLLIRMNKDANIVQNKLKEAGILVKNVSNMHKNLHNCLRISIGTLEENNKLLEWLKKIKVIVNI